LERGDAVPAPAAAIVAHALRQYLAGDCDLSRNLGLRPLRLEQVAQRNESIQAIFAAMPGTTQKDRAEQTAQLMRSPPDPRINEAEVFQHLVQLYEHHAGTLPGSSRQVIRIVKGETVDARRPDHDHTKRASSS
jgi:hypothetical protein